MGDGIDKQLVVSPTLVGIELNGNVSIEQKVEIKGIV